MYLYEFSECEEGGRKIRGRYIRRGEGGLLKVWGSKQKVNSWPNMKDKA